MRKVSGREMEGVEECAWGYLIRKSVGKHQHELWW